jgi:hypothetical protein
MDMAFSLLLTERMLNKEATDSCDARHNEEVSTVFNPNSTVKQTLSPTLQLTTQRSKKTPWILGRSK